MKKVLLLCLLALGCELQVSAQSVPLTDDAAKLFLPGSTTSLQKGNFDPSGKSALVNGTPNVALNSTLNAGADAKIQAVYHFGTSWSGSVSAQQQLGKTDSSATFYNFAKGISPGTTIAFNLQKIFWEPKMSKAEFNKFDGLANAYAAATGKDRRLVTYQEIASHGSQQQKDELADIHLVLPVFVNFQFALTRSSFSYTSDSVKLKKVDQSYFTPVIKLSIGLPMADLKSFLSFSYLYSDNYKAGNSTTFLMPFGKSGNLVSQSLIFGAPKKTTDHHISAEYRRSFGKEEADFAIDPTITYGFSSKQLALEMPIYFIKGVTKGKATGLQGGIDLGYLTDTNKFTSFKQGFGAQLIVSLPFSVFDGLLH